MRPVPRLELSGSGVNLGPAHINHCPKKGGAKIQRLKTKTSAINWGNYSGEHLNTSLDSISELQHHFIQWWIEPLFASTSKLQYHPIRAWSIGSNFPQFIVSYVQFICELKQNHLYKQNDATYRYRNTLISISTFTISSEFMSYKLTYLQVANKWKIPSRIVTNCNS